MGAPNGKIGIVGGNYRRSRTPSNDTIREKWSKSPCNVLTTFRRNGIRILMSQMSCDNQPDNIFLPITFEVHDMISNGSMKVTGLIDIIVNCRE
jgi:hypothetical protein